MKPRRLFCRSGQHAPAAVRVILLVCLLGVGGCKREGGGAETFTWQTSEAAALAVAEAERKPIIINFWVGWSGACAAMYRTTYNDERFQKAAARFVALSVDATIGSDPSVVRILQKYQVKDFPTMLIIDSSGREQKRFTGGVGVETAVSAMENVK